jgi:hypothetical protein
MPQANQKEYFVRCISHSNTLVWRNPAFRDGILWIRYCQEAGRYTLLQLHYKHKAILNNDLHQNPFVGPFCPIDPSITGSAPSLR